MVGPLLGDFQFWGSQERLKTFLNSTTSNENLKINEQGQALAQIVNMEQMTTEGNMAATMNMMEGTNMTVLLKAAISDLESLKEAAKYRAENSDAFFLIIIAVIIYCEYDLHFLSRLKAKRLSLSHQGSRQCLSNKTWSIGLSWLRPKVNSPLVNSPLFGCGRPKP